MEQFEKALKEILSSVDYKFLCEKIIKEKVQRSDNSFEYKDFSQTMAGVEYLVKPEYVSGEEIYKHAKNSCNMCWGKGYKVLNLEKRKFPNPKDYILLAQQPLNDLTEEQKKILVEREKLSKMWRILLPCSCAIKGIIKKDKHLFVSVDGNICFRINYEVKAN